MNSSQSFEDDIASHSEEIPQALLDQYQEDSDDFYDQNSQQESEIQELIEESEINNQQNKNIEDFSDSQINQIDEKENQINDFNLQLRQFSTHQSKEKILFSINSIKSKKNNDEKQQYDNSKYIQKQEDTQQISNQNQLQEDQQDFQQLLKQLNTSLLENNNSFINQHSILKKNNNKSYEFNNGIGFLNAKSLLFQEYVINLHIYLLKKIQGKQIDSEFIQKLLYQKTLLQKMKPVEKKLDYQVQKLLRLSQKQLPDKQKDKQNLQNQQQNLNNKKNKLNEDHFDDNIVDESSLDLEDPYTLKPNPDHLINSDQSEEEDNAVQKYKAPKLLATLSKEEKQIQAQQRREENRKAYLRRQLADNFIQDDGSQKEQKNTQYAQKKLDKWEEEREKYEMENYVRLPTTKKDKIREKQIRKTKQQKEYRLDDFTEEKQIRELLGYEGVIDREKKRQSKNNPRKQQSVQKDNKEGEFFKKIPRNHKQKKQTRRIK